jgi:3-deoxy-7-phosphoheptulonate synthase
MLVVMRVGATPKEIKSTVAAIRRMGLKPNVIPGALRVAIGITGNRGAIPREQLEVLPGVAELVPVTKPYKLVSRETKPEDTVVSVGSPQRRRGRGGIAENNSGSSLVTAGKAVSARSLRSQRLCGESPAPAVFGGSGFAVIAGPCAVESLKGALAVARAVKAAGAGAFRGGAYKPRTSPYSFQGLGKKGLDILRAVREETGLPVVTEAVDPESLEQVARHADMIQIGARNMQNYSLLRLAGQSKRPVLLKRGFSATFEEFLMAAEYILSEGNYQVVLCVRGVRTFADYTRSTLDISLVPAVQKISHLPIIADPSHAAGRRDMVPALSRAALAAGAHGLIVGVHADPDRALSDGGQSLTLEGFAELMGSLRRIAGAMDAGQ